MSEALLGLHDPIALRAHPLSGRFGGAAGLRTELTQAIDALRPSAQVDPTSRAWRPYHLLTLRYAEGLDATEVASRLAVSRSQYYREHEGALAAITEVLRERGLSDPAVTPPPPVADVLRRRGPRRGLMAALAATLFVLVTIVAALVFVLPSARPSPPLKPTLAVYAGDGVSGYANGPAATARFAGPFGLAVDASGTVFVADTGNNRIRRITTSGLVLDAAGSGVAGHVDGPSDEARFSSPNAVTVVPDGTIYVADSGNLRLRAISPSGRVTTLAGSGQPRYGDGVGTAASFAVLGNVISGPDGTLYVTDPGNNVVRRITPGGVVSTFAGNGHRGHVDGPANVAEFNVPMRGGGVDRAGNVYLLDTGDNRIRKIAPDGTVSTVAGTGVAGYLDGPVSQAQFSSDILGLITDPDGNLFVMDSGNRRIRKVSSGGIVSTLLELADPSQTPGNIKIDPAGNLFLSDRAHNVIYKVAAR